MALAALLGGIIGVSLVNRELNPMVVYGYLTAFVLLVAGNAIYVFFKRKKNHGSKNENHNHGQFHTL